jgi:dinuclear metal center YbgI/SA1388 family protein
MITIAEITNHLESLAPVYLQESYDNAGLITGSKNWQCTGIICTLDATEEVILEAVSKKCNLIVAHHPIVFKGLKKINGKDYVEKAIITAIKNDIAIYAIHTNLDNVIDGVSGRMAALLGLKNPKVLSPQKNILKKLTVYIPTDKAEGLRNALFQAGAGHIGNYSHCSFNSEGIGSFQANDKASPYIGQIGETHFEKESKVEIVFPTYLERLIVSEMKAAHPYEEVAYDIVNLDNEHHQVGSGIIAELEESVDEAMFLTLLQKTFNIPVVKHTRFLGKPIKKVALCGGAGSFLIGNALTAGADIFITGDIKYHEFFDANDRMLIADIGHYESEQYTIDQLFEILHHKFTTFAILKTEVRTNPVHYFATVKG